jgi:hypothetical protein
MRTLALPLLLALAGCVAAAPAPEPRADPRRSGELRQEPSEASLRTDVEGSVAERFGAAALRRAQTAEASVMTKLYQGLPPPPVRQPDGSWAHPAHPLAVVVREGGRWVKLTPQGDRALGAAAVTEIEQLLAARAFWAEPRRLAQGGCTDGGSTLLVVRWPAKGSVVRQGTCGGPPLGHRLVSAVLNG